jgi:amino acid adenylation domain-containing protein
MGKLVTLTEGFLRAEAKYAQRDALDIKGQKYTYKELHQSSSILANTLTGFLSDEIVFVGIFSSRSLSAFQGVLATLYCGKAYVPIDLTASPQRVLEVIRECDCKIFIVDQMAEVLLSTVIDELEPSIFIFPQAESSSLEPWPSKHQVVFSNALSDNKDFLMVSINSEQLAYLLFTSGSTGKPKGVPISHKNICAYLTDIACLYPLYPDDRCTQAFELTFDPSVHDMFATWFGGACLYVMDERERLGAQYFIKKNEITVWNTLPSIVKLCLQTRSFSESYLSSLKYVFFNGEPLTELLVSELQDRVPQAKLINFYGLTETTVNLSHYCWDQKRSPEFCRNGIVPIASFFKNVGVHLLKAQGEQGSGQFELCLSGDQIFKGYLNSDNNERLFFNDNSGVRYLKTGDLVEHNNKDGKILHIIGRTDDQVKISGHRVDLNIIRFTLEKISNSMDALVLKRESPEGDAQLIGFLKGKDIDVDQIKHEVNAQMPVHMKLSSLILVENYPYLVSGKINKRALLEQASKAP